MGISKELADECFAVVKYKYRAYFDTSVGSGPMFNEPLLVENFNTDQPGSWLILWEDGPEEWAYTTATGDSSEEVAWLIAEAVSEQAARDYRANPQEGVTWPEGVHVEVANHYSLSLWEA